MNLQNELPSESKVQKATESTEQEASASEVKLSCYAAVITTIGCKRWTSIYKCQIREGGIEAKETKRVRRTDKDSKSSFLKRVLMPLLILKLPPSWVKTFRTPLWTACVKGISSSNIFIFAERHNALLYASWKPFPIRLVKSGFNKVFHVCKHITGTSNSTRPTYLQLMCTVAYRCIYMVCTDVYT